MDDETPRAGRATRSRAEANQAGLARSRPRLTEEQATQSVQTYQKLKEIHAEYERDVARLDATRRRWRAVIAEATYDPGITQVEITRIIGKTREHVRRVVAQAEEDAAREDDPESNAVPRAG